MNVDINELLEEALNTVAQLQKEVWILRVSNRELQDELKGDDE